MSVSFVGAGTLLDEVDYQTLSTLINIPEAALHAVVDVETSGKGFDPQGRVRMLFEPHVFYKRLKGAKRIAAVKAGLAYAKWGTKPYPKDSYPRLLKAMEIDETAALESASWGLGQLMGYNHTTAGYSTVQDMINDFADDEENQLKAMVLFIKTNKLDRYLRVLDFTGFARGYNGEGFEKNGYDRKMKTRYAYWVKVKPIVKKRAAPVADPDPVEDDETPADDTPAPAPAPAPVVSAPTVATAVAISDIVQPSIIDQLKGKAAAWIPFKSRILKGGSVALAGMAAQADDIKDKLSPYADIKIIGTILTIITFAGVIYMIWSRIDDHHTGANDKT